MIHSSAIEGHQFPMSRRRGYDPAEVDAVMSRLVATLRRYEEREESLRREATAVTDLQVIRSERVDEEATEAAVEEALTEARRKLEDADREASVTLADAEEEATRVVEIARAEAAGLLYRRNTRAEELITSALSEVKALRARVLRETNEYRDGTKTEADAMVRTAQLQADQMLEDARHEAGSILGRARREQMLLEQRIGQLRSAVAGIEDQFRNLAETTLEQTEIMATMLSLETDTLERVLEETGNDTPRTDDEPDVVRLTQERLTIDLTGAGEEAPPVGKRTDEHYVVTPGNTIYQKRGRGLRRRLEAEGVEELPERSD